MPSCSTSTSRGGGGLIHELRSVDGQWVRSKPSGSVWSPWGRVISPDGPVRLSDGGTGARDAEGARESLGIASLHDRAPYVRGLSTGSKLYSTTIIKNVTSMYVEVMSAAQVRSLIGRDPIWGGNDFAVVVNGDETASTNQVHVLLNLTTKDIDARVRGEDGGAPKTGSMRLDVLIYAA